MHALKFNKFLQINSKDCFQEISVSTQSGSIERHSLKTIEYWGVKEGG